MKIVAVIPCFNEGKMVGDIVAKAQKYCQRVIVVDNMSTDNTIDEAEQHILCYNIQRCFVKGAGASTAMGLTHSLNPLSHLYGDIIVTLDGDGQHNPDEIPQIVKPIVDGKADVVIGSRFLEEYYIPPYRKFGVDVITWLYNVGHKQKISDAQSCFRAFRRDVVDALIPIEKGFPFSVEVLIKARKMHLRIEEVPISCIYHDDYKQDSTINPIRHGLSVAWAVIRWRAKLELGKKAIDYCPTQNIPVLADKNIREKLCVDCSAKDCPSRKSDYVIERFKEIKE